MEAPEPIGGSEQSDKGDQDMIRVVLKQDQIGEFPEDAYAKWGFERKEGNQWVAALGREEFQKFLQKNNLIVYKNHIKDYKDGREYGEFSVVE